MTHDISSMLAENEPCMWGSATLVMLVSRTCITVTIITENVMAHLWADPTGASLIRSRSDASLNNFVRPHQQRRRDRQAEGLSGLPIDGQLVLRRLFDGEIRGLGAFENLVDVDGGAAKQLGEAGAV